MRRIEITKLAVGWNAFWFPKSTPIRLAICRILTIGAQLLLFRPTWSQQEDLLKNELFHSTEMVVRVVAKIVSNDQFRTVEFLWPLWCTTMISGVFALFGLATRPAVFLFAAGNSLLIAHVYSYGAFHHANGIFCLFLVLLAFSPCGRCLSIDSLIGRRFGKTDQWGLRAPMFNAIWPLRLVQCVMALAYFSGAYAKLAHSGLAWMNGYTLQTKLFQDYVRWDQRFGDFMLWGREIGLWLAKQFYVCQVLSFGTVLFELTFFVAIISRRLWVLYLLAGASMHTLIYITQGAAFLQWILLYIIFLDLDRLRVYIEDRTGYHLGLTMDS